MKILNIYKFRILVILISCTFLLSSCKKSEQKKISVFYSSYDDEYINSIRADLDRFFAKSRGIFVENHNGFGSSQTQMKQIKSAIDSGTNLLVINLASSPMDTIVNIASLAKEANIPLIFFESPVPWQVSELNKESMIISTDFSDLGKSFGSAVGKYLAENYESTDKNSDGKISYVLFKTEDVVLKDYDISRYAIEEADRILAPEGKSALRHYDGEEFGSVILKGASDKKKGCKDSIVAIMKEEGKEQTPEIIICENDTAALGVHEGVMELGRKIPIFSLDGTEAVARLEDEHLISPIVRNGEKVSDSIAKVSCNFLKNKDRFSGIPKSTIANNYYIRIPFSFRNK